MRISVFGAVFGAVMAPLILLAAGAVELRAQAADPNQVFSPRLFEDLRFRMVGPTRGGRATTVTGIAEQPSTFFMGATGGGVWKTTDFGQHWENVSDGYFETASIGAIQVADSDPDVVYVGTGTDGIRSNVITGRGVYKSTDGGNTWAFVGLRDAGQIGAVEVHPQDPDEVFVAAIGHAFGPNPERGIYRSLDGGTSWEQVLFVSDSTGAVDLEFAPDNPDEIYACMWRGERKPWTIISGAYEGGVYKSTDGGDTWTELTNGLPRGLRGKSDLAVSRADPDRVYVLYEAPAGEGGLYRSDDRGGSFRLVSTQQYLLDRPFYYLNVDADPSDADVLYVNSTRFFKSTDGGVTWHRRPTPHGDNHDIWINPNDPDLFVQCNDGGANVTRDGGVTWSTQSNQPTAELYQVDVDDQYPYWLYAGQQDNTTITVPSAPPYSAPGGHTGYWREAGGCETGPAVPKPGDPNIVYANCKGRFGRYNKTTGQEKQFYVGAANMYGHNPRDLDYRFQRVSPIEVSPHDPNIVYHGSQFLHETTNEGETWQTISPDLTAFDPATQVISGSPITRDITGEEFHSTIYAIEESPLEQGVIWVGANDGPVHLTRDGGATWAEITPPDLPPYGRIQNIEPSPHRAGKAYFAAYRYLLDDFQPYIYRTDDYGRSWTRLTTGSNGIPGDFPTRVVREDPDREGLLYAGTEFGLFISFDDGAHWQSFQQNLPVTPVTDIKVHRRDLVISTMGRSFWIMDNLTPLHELSSRVAPSPVHLFEPMDAYRTHSSTGYGSRSGGPQYEPVSAQIDYYLSATPTEPVTLEILDAGGTLIREFSSTGPVTEAEIPAEPGMGGFLLERLGTRRLSSERGMHRFHWDMRHAGAWDADAAAAGRRGPLVAPGRYQARLSVGRGFSRTIEFDLLIEPRVAADGVTPEDLEAQTALNLEIRDFLSEAKMVLHRLQSLARQTRARGETVGDNSEVARAISALHEEISDLHSQFATAEGRYQEPKLISQIHYLHRMTNSADQRPGDDAYMRLNQLRQRFEEYDSRFRNIVDSEIPALNRQLQANGLDPVQL